MSIWFCPWFHSFAVLKSLKHLNEKIPRNVQVSRNHFVLLYISRYELLQYNPWTSLYLDNAAEVSGYCSFDKFHLISTLCGKSNWGSISFHYWYISWVNATQDIKCQSFNIYSDNQKHIVYLKTDCLKLALSEVKGELKFGPKTAYNLWNEERREWDKN